MRAVILLTVCRRYHELTKNLARTRELALAELGYVPDVVVVWARPEVCRLWLFRELLAGGSITHLLTRQGEQGEGGATTRPESLNIRLGLLFLKDNYPGHYALVHAADVRPRGDTLGFVQDKFDSGHKACVFHWENGCARDGVWHTNFFAACLQEEYWPPVSPADEQDVLERQWGKRLQALGPPGIFCWHNSGGKRFAHGHESEGLPEFPSKPQAAGRVLGLSVRGHLSRRDRLVRGVRQVWRYLWRF